MHTHSAVQAAGVSLPIISLQPFQLPDIDHVNIVAEQAADDMLLKIIKTFQAIDSDPHQCNRPH